LSSFSGASNQGFHPSVRVEFPIQRHRNNRSPLPPRHFRPLHRLPPVSVHWPRHSNGLLAEQIRGIPAPAPAEQAPPAAQPQPHPAWAWTIPWLGEVATTDQALSSSVAHPHLVPYQTSSDSGEAAIRCRQAILPEPGRALMSCEGPAPHPAAPERLFPRPEEMREANCSNAGRSPPPALPGRYQPGPPARRWP